MSFRYPGAESPAVSRISLTIESGERLAVVGSSGSGKSTLGLLLAGLLQPTQGGIVEHTSTRAMRLKDDRFDARTASKSVAIVFQYPESQLVSATVEEDVALGPENLGLASDEIRRRVDWALATLGIEHLARRPIESLSGGEKQRVAVAGALAMQPGCLVLDEASSMLHPEAKRQLEEALVRIQQDGVAVVQITHDMEEADTGRSGRPAPPGRAHRRRPARLVLSDEPLLSRSGLEPPESLELALGLRRGGVDLPGDILDIPSLADAIAKAVTR